MGGVFTREKEIVKGRRSQKQGKGHSFVRFAVSVLSPCEAHGSSLIGLADGMRRHGGTKKSPQARVASGLFFERDEID
ncbi:MAG: hypothetical protein EAZ81_04990 [Verrucomicrobia bacterium]|nr:MAG: hypothetical protein EAZ81_04990 [Verrucomicrobiota bacterium]